MLVGDTFVTLLKEHWKLSMTSAISFSEDESPTDKSDIVLVLLKETMTAQKTTAMNKRVFSICWISVVCFC